MKLFRWHSFSVTAAIAILAMVLLMVAPVISGHLTRGDAAQHTQHEQHLYPVQPAQVEGLHHAHMASFDHAVQQTKGEPSQGAACGYCELLIHVPFFLWLFQPLLLFFPRIFWQPIHRTVVSHYRFSRLTCYQTRAPPAFIWL